MCRIFQNRLTFSSVLFCIALFAVPAFAQAATWLGDQQGVPTGYIGRTTPDDIACWIIWDGKFPKNNYNNWPDCRGMNADKTMFYSAAFSLSPTDPSAGSYPTNIYVAAYWTKDTYTGLATVTPILGCSDPTYNTDQASCENSGASWGTGYCQGATGATEYYCSNAGGTWVLFGDTYDCKKYPTPSGETGVYYYDPSVGEYALYRNTQLQVQCWAEKFYPTYPADALNPSAIGQTAYMTSTYKGYTKVKDLGPATADGYCSYAGYTTESACVNNGGQWTSYNTYSCPYTPTVSGDRVEYTDPAYPWEVYGFYGAYECWEFAPVTGSVVHQSPSLKGSALTVAPNTPLTLQWSCQPQHKTEIGNCSYNLYDSRCVDYVTDAYWLNPLFSGSSGSGQGFATGNKVAGLAQFNAPYLPGSYTYGLTCAGAKPATMQITIKVGDLCPTAIPDAKGGNTDGFTLPSNTTWYRINKFTYNFCVNNGGIVDYYIPANTAAELKSFVDSTLRLPGVTTF